MKTYFLKTFQNQMTTWFEKPYVLYFDHNNNPVYVHGKHADGLLMCSIMPDSTEPSGHINVARASFVYQQALFEKKTIDQISASQTKTSQ